MPNFFPTQKMSVVTKLSSLIRDNCPISLILTRDEIFNILFFDLTLNPAVKYFGFRTLRSLVRVPPIMKTAVECHPAADADLFSHSRRLWLGFLGRLISFPSIPHHKHYVTDLPQGSLRFQLSTHLRRCSSSLSKENWKRHWIQSHCQ